MSVRRRWLRAFVLAVIVQWVTPNSIIIVEDACSPCYRRLLAGKKSLDLHIRRAVECEKIEECHRACDFEKFFICEGFNYRRLGHGTRGMCEMTSVPYSRMDLGRDFESDPQCDYYEKDPNCAANAPGAQPSWSNQPSRSGQTYGSPFPSAGRQDTRPYTPNRRPSNEVSRPLDYDRRPLDFDRRPTNEIPRPPDYDRRPSTVYGDFHRVPYDDTFDQRNYPRDQDTIRDGFPAENRFSNQFPSRRPTTDDDSYDRNWSRHPKYPDRRIDHGSAHDIGTNEIGSYGAPEHRKNPSRDWGTYSTVYGGSYGYDTNYVGQYDMPKHYPKPQPKPSRPYDNDHFYGEFYNYGGAFGYGDNYIPANQDPLYGGSERTDECSVRAGAGFKLNRDVVRKTYLTPNLDQCESLCVNEKSYACLSFSYRYNVAPTNPTDNCLLSDVLYKDLNFYTDLEPDRDYDVYAVIASSRTCGTKRGPRPPDECFWRVRSGFGMPEDVVRKSTIVGNLGDCQVECTITQDFTCRSFAFKYGLEQDRQNAQTNCYLSDWPTQDINPANMPDMDGVEIYERGSFGRGCEPYAVPYFNMGRFTDKQSPRGDEACYSGYKKPCKLTPYVVLLATYVNSEQDCRQKCSKMRESSSIPCMSYSYKLTTHGTEENCLLSDVAIRDLRPGLDFTFDNNHVLYAWKDLDPRCMIIGYYNSIDDMFGRPESPKPLIPDISGPDYDSGYEYPRPDNGFPDPRPFFGRPKPNGHRPGTRPFDPDNPNAPGMYRPGGGYGGHDNKFGYGIKPDRPDYGSFYPDEQSTFRYYTVNGYPCKRGTRCERNKVAGFWACETEGSEYGSWDYCCAPTHHCGFSQGYNYLWCYVGAAEEQWRPCSDKYFPYLPSPRPMRPTINGDDRYDGPDPRDPGHNGRHWPVTYLHRRPPPNCTDSLASADNSNHRHSDDMTTTTTTTTAATAITTAPNAMSETAKPSAVAKGRETTQDRNGTNANAKTTRRRRLRLRMAHNGNNVINGDLALVSRKIGARITTSDAYDSRERERVAKIERVSKPTGVAPFAASNATVAAAATVAPLAAAGDTDARETRRAGESRSRDGGGMIRVPLLAPNNSLPAGA